MKYHLLLPISLFAACLHAQAPDTSTLFRTLAACDSLLFQVGFNTCDVAQFERLTSEDFEFYHDQSGITPSKAAFIENTRNGLCKLDYQPLRELVPGTMQVFPLKKNGVLYGAIQSGEHHFLAKYPGKEAYLTSVAKFTHLWLLENGEWQLSRVLSFEHKSPENGKN
jgi:hypothetical protein